MVHRGIPAGLVAWLVDLAKITRPIIGGDLMSSQDWYAQIKRICRLIGFWEYLYAREYDLVYMKYANCLRADLQEILKIYKETLRKEIEATA